MTRERDLVCVVPEGGEAIVYIVLVSIVYGVWCMVYGVWCMVYGVWCTVLYRYWFHHSTAYPTPKGGSGLQNE
jgi:hypothetical protein